jgi:hypothetical protein
MSHELRGRECSGQAPRPVCISLRVRTNNTCTAKPLSLSASRRTAPAHCRPSASGGQHAALRPFAGTASVEAAPSSAVFGLSS